MTDISAILADNMRRFRKSKGFSQERLGEISDLHRTYIGGIEQERINPSVRNLEKVAIALDVDPAMLLFEFPRCDKLTVPDASSADCPAAIDPLADSETGSRRPTHYFVVEETDSALALRELSAQGQAELGKLLEEDSKRK